MENADLKRILTASYFSHGGSDIRTRVVGELLRRLICLYRTQRKRQKCLAISANRRKSSRANEEHPGYEGPGWDCIALLLLSLVDEALPKNIHEHFQCLFEHLSSNDQEKLRKILPWYACPDLSVDRFPAARKELMRQITRARKKLSLTCYGILLRARDLKSGRFGVEVELLNQELYSIYSTFQQRHVVGYFVVHKLAEIDQSQNMSVSIPDPENLLKKIENIKLWRSPRPKKSDQILDQNDHSDQEATY